jgi:omega-6 fatty acid desaturase (delta-12 desaturase)
LNSTLKPAPSLHARTRAYARDSSLKSWWVIASTAFVLALVTLGTLPPFPMALRIVCSVVSGLLMMRFFVIYHDQQHRAILPRSFAAELLMRVFGIWTMCPSSIWRSSHDHHHAHNSKLRGSNIGSFPIMTREHYQEASSGERFVYLFMRHPLTLLAGYFTVFFVGMVSYPIFRSPRKHYDCLLALLVHLALNVSVIVCFGWVTALLLIWLPRTLGSAMGSYLFYAQHNFPGVRFKDKCGWTYEGAAMESSSYLKTGPLMAWFTGNIGYHHIHHLNHRIPFYRLPEIYRDMPELQQAKITTLHPREIWRCFRLKVWCVKSQRMVGVRGL